jgi:hypothetical protein
MPDRLPGMSSIPAAPDDAVRARIDDRRAAFLDDIVEWLRTLSAPSNRSTPAVCGAVPERGPELAAMGCPVTEVWEITGAPAVFAEWRSAVAGGVGS